jgi:hypothetical protein
LKGDHPDHPDAHVLNQRFAKHISESWKKLEKEDQKKWRQEFPKLFFGATGIMLPITFTKERITTKIDDKEKIMTNALMVSSPAKYGKLMKALLDIAVLNKRINNLIPFALNRENPEGFYYLVAAQARFIENHRNIPIMNIPVDANSHKGNKGETLIDILNGHTAIQRVSYDPKQQKYHVSTTAPKYREVHQWVTTVLKENRFSYSPQLRPMKYGNGSGSVSYSAIFQDAMSVANTTYDASTIKTTQSNAWKNRPPLDISYDPTDEAFPSLPKAKESIPTTPSTTSETLDGDTIQSAISTAIKKLEDQHRAELAQLKREFQKKLDAVENQMKELGQQVATQTYQALVQEESPLATKADHAHLQHEISVMTTQLSTLIQMCQQGMTHHFPPSDTNTTSPKSSFSDFRNNSPARTTKRSKFNLTPEKITASDNVFTEEHSVSSATSDPDEGMEGCEE